MDNPMGTGGSEQDRESNLEKKMTKTFLVFVFLFFHEGILLSSMHATS
jgi:preprotein translocase subunit SecG